LEVKTTVFLLITVFKDGQENKMFLETAVRYGKLNFYLEDGKPEKREQVSKGDRS